MDRSPEQPVLLGTGALSCVWLRPSEPGIAVKVLRKDVLVALHQVDVLLREVSVLRRLSDSGGCMSIMQLRRASHDPERVYLHTTAALTADQRSVHLRRLREAQPSGVLTPQCVCGLTVQLSGATVHLHERRIMHRDLKPENVVMAADTAGCRPVLVDFGAARALEHDGERSTSLHGTLAYLAPEMLGRKGHARAADWWSIGVILYELLTGDLPFPAACQAELAQAHERAAALPTPTVLEVPSPPLGSAVASAEALPCQLLRGLLHAALRLDETAREAAARLWSREAADRATQREHAIYRAEEDALSAALARVSATTSSEVEDDDDEEAAVARAWAQAEREELFERAQLMWARTREKWQPTFDAAFGAEHSVLDLVA